MAVTVHHGSRTRSDTNSTVIPEHEAATNAQTNSHIDSASREEAIKRQVKDNNRQIIPAPLIQIFSSERKLKCVPVDSTVARVYFRLTGSRMSADPE